MRCIRNRSGTATWRTPARDERAAYPAPMNPLTKGTSRGTSPAPGAGPAVATAATPPGQATLTASEPNIQKTSFDGLSRSGGPEYNGEPPDPWVAVGPDHVMQVTNSSFRTTERQGIEKEATAFAAFVDTFGFLELTEDVVWFDPHVIFDSLHGRWLLTMDGFDCNSDPVGTEDPALRGHGYLFFATSDTIDPTAFWTGSYLLGNDTLIDYTAPGMSTDKMAFASNTFSMDDPGTCQNPTTYEGGDVSVIDWADWLEFEPCLHAWWRQHHDRHIRPARGRAISGHQQHAPRRHRDGWCRPRRRRRLLHPDRLRRIGNRGGLRGRRRSD